MILLIITVFSMWIPISPSAIRRSGEKYAINATIHIIFTNKVIFRRGSNLNMKQFTKQSVCWQKYIKRRLLLWKSSYSLPGGFISLISSMNKYEGNHSEEEHHSKWVFKWMLSFQMRIHEMNLSTLRVDGTCLKSTFSTHPALKPPCD